ncbi:MAG TPA: TlpA disulfide reductase family protein [Pyrinomonadaceae bacterium]|nr:TlpA disulfide reductase family protein [Pyrinomonadaceae bacterium]
MSKVKLGIWITVVLCVGVVFVGCSSKGIDPDLKPAATNETKVGTEVGNSAPDFRLTKIDGSQISLADLKGRPAVLIFWTAWCPICKEEAPLFNALAEKYEPRGVHVLGINIQDSVARTEGGINDFGIRYRVARDADASVARRYRVTGTPTIVLLDRQGVVHYFGNGLPSDYGERLDAMLAAGA